MILTVFYQEKNEFLVAFFPLSLLTWISSTQATNGIYQHYKKLELFLLGISQHGFLNSGFVEYN